MRSFFLAPLSVLIALVPLFGQSSLQHQATVAYLQACQQPDGGFLPAKLSGTANAQARSSLRATTAALRALKYFGGEAHDRTACSRFVQRCFDKASGGFGDYPGAPPDVVSTAVGIMALVELKLPVENYREATVRYLAERVRSFEDIRIAAAALEAIGARPPVANAWLEEIGKLRHANGTYGTGTEFARATGGAVVAVLRLGGTVEHRETVLQALKVGQHADGGYGKQDAKSSDLESCYRVMRAFAMLKDKPDSQGMRSFVVRCRNMDGGYGVTPGEPSSVGATYYASIILHWLQ
ncbi:MAG TPA: prenyltransferase/squalene oxidase repeat-containing protein [Gemmataceae bacterium]|nr:prenyltransferase/squalene oxidase repeat-containing protein [Gemmataceae bacterium]